MCVNEIRRHVRLWKDAGLRERLPVIVDDTLASFEDHPIQFVIGEGLDAMSTITKADVEQSAPDWLA